MSSDDQDTGTARASASLYDWWLNVVPAFFGATATGTAAPQAPDASTLPFPLGQVMQALAMTKGALGPLYQNFFQALLTRSSPAEALAAFQGLMAHPMAQPMAMLGDAWKPLSINLEHTYGGLADAFGLAPSRELQDAAREMAAAKLARQRAQAEYMGLVFASLARGSQALMARLAQMGRDGESVDSLLGLVRLWARTADEGLHRDMQSPQALQASASLMRAAMTSREQQQRVVAIVSEALNVPTRAEVDDAYREIQELKRELRRLKKALAAVLPATAMDASVVEAPAAASTPTKPASKPRPKTARAQAAKRSRTAKAIDP